MQLSDFIVYVKRDFKRTDKDTEIIRAYNDMLTWLSAKFPIGDYKFQSYVLTSPGVEDYELPVNLAHLIHPIRLLDGSNSSDNGAPLNHISKEEYDRREPNPNRNNPSTSKPDSYTVYSRSILLTPIPDLSTYVLEIPWSKRPNTQAQDTDLHSFGTEYDETLKFGTLERLYDGMQQYDVAAYWASKYKDSEGMPIGMLKDLLNNEISREGEAVTIVRPNQL